MELALAGLESRWKMPFRPRRAIRSIVNPRKCHVISDPIHVILRHMRRTKGKRMKTHVALGQTFFRSVYPATPSSRAIVISRVTVLSLIA